MSGELLANGKVTLHCGECVELMNSLHPCSVDAIVTDPPYHLTSIVRRFGKEGATENKDYGKSGVYKRSAAGFMQKTWDGGDVAFRPETWMAAYRILKPGGHLIAFSGCRTYHRMTTAIEDAGFEVREMLSWIFGSGFPKSHKVGEGLGTALKPAHEPICMARKPLIGTVVDNVLAHGTGAINIDACRVASGGEHFRSEVKHRNEGGWADAKGMHTPGRGFIPTNHEGGRWPANVLHDGSDEVVAAFPDTVSGAGNKANKKPLGRESQVIATRDIGQIWAPDEGSAARFFYSAKADGDDRLGSKHPTVKPVDLMQYLVRLVTPPGGIVLDCFAGTGTTGEAAFREGMRAILIERELEYQQDIRRRMNLVLGGPDERKCASLKASGKIENVESLPLFGGV